MNVINAQVEVLKDALKKKKQVIYGTVGDSVVIGNDNRLYIIPKKSCGVNFATLDNHCIKHLEESRLKFFMNDSKYKDIIITDEVRVTTDKKILRVFLNGDERIYLDEKLTKNFDLKNSTFKGYSAKSIVYIYENDVMVGIVLPVYVK